MATDEYGWTRIRRKTRWWHAAASGLYPRALAVIHRVRHPDGHFQLADAGLGVQRAPAYAGGAALIGNSHQRPMGASLARARRHWSSAGKFRQEPLIEVQAKEPGQDKLPAHGILQQLP